MTLENIIGFLPVYAGMLAWLRLSIKRPFSSLGFKRQGAIQSILGGALAGVLMVAMMAGLVILPSATLEMGDLQKTGLTGLGMGLLSLGSYSIQASAEEILFRGWLLPVLASRYCPWIGVLVSTPLFSLAHGANPEITPLAFLNLFLFGGFAAFLALAEGGLWGACAWHAVWNWTEFALLGFPLGGASHRGTLVSVRTTGTNLITGGSFGPEGGLAATAVLLIAIGIVIATSPTQN